MNQRPVAIGLLLCEQVIIAEKTRNITPVNCFTKRVVDSFPSQPFPFVVFAILTDGIGNLRLEIVVQRLDTLGEVYHHEAAVRITNPLHEVRCVIRFRDCSFPVAGEYQAIILADGELIAQKKFRIVQKEESE